MKCDRCDREIRKDEKFVELQEWEKTGNSTESLDSNALYYSCFGDYLQFMDDNAPQN